MFLTKSSTTVLVGVSASALLGLGAVAHAAQRDTAPPARASAGTLHACVTGKDRHLRYVARAAGCRDDEKALSWNRTGPAGAPGEPGQPGAPGEPGTGGGGAPQYYDLGGQSLEGLGGLLLACDAGDLATTPMWSLPSGATPRQSYRNSASSWWLSLSQPGGASDSANLLCLDVDGDHVA